MLGMRHVSLGHNGVGQGTRGKRNDAWLSLSERAFIMFPGAPCTTPRRPGLAAFADIMTVRTKAVRR